MAMATELRVPMSCGKAGCAAIFLLAAQVCAAGQSIARAPEQTSQPASPETSKPASAPHRPKNHIRVAEDDPSAPPLDLTQAEAFIEKQNYGAAESLLQKVVERDAMNYEAWFDLGFVENALGKLEASIDAYRKSVSAKPDVFESNLNLGLQLAKSGSLEAEGFLRVATKLDPAKHPADGQYRAWLALGDVLKKSNAEEALSAYHEASALQPKEAEPHLAAGVILEEESKAGEAEQEYKRAMALDPGGTDAATALANLYMRGRRFPEAEDYLRKLLAGHAPEARVEVQLGRVLAAEGKNDEAMAALAAGIRLAPEDEAAQRDLADLYSSGGKNDLAESAYRKLLAAHPNDGALHRSLGQALLRQKKFLPAQEEFLTTVRLKPDLGEAYGDLAFTAGENKNYELALRALDARAKLLPEIPITYFLRASALDHLHEFKKAAANYRLFLNSAKGQYPDQEWQAKHRLITIEPKK
jgi:tetratricopeptide (TPR) repeat protein